MFTLAHLRRTSRAALHFLFPPHCAHCHAACVEDFKPFCAACRTLFEAAPLAQRCRSCFSDDGPGVCPPCRTRKVGCMRVAAALENRGPVRTLHALLKHGGRRPIAKDCSAWMALQLVHLEWPLPDLIVPVPRSPEKRLSGGKDPSLLLAQELGLWMGAPVENLLARRIGVTGDDAFKWRKKRDIAGQTILLIDDLIHTGETIHSAARLLKERFPAAIYGMVLAR